ncbi:MAG: hypothetical protein HPY50_13640 [Firmicutes bacterium]|nr:hypothetical protein [Bacillota bacterium]
MPDISIRQFLHWNGFDPTVGLRGLLPGGGGSVRRLLAFEIQDLGRMPADKQISFEELISPIVREAFKAPTITYLDDDGYYYDELTEPWKVMCSGLPCFESLHWPDYETLPLEINLMGMPVVIQMWKGWCQRFLGSQSFPGGVGAEVGIYHRVPGQKLPDFASFITAGFRDFILNAIKAINDSEIWWPVTDPVFLSNIEIEFELINPENNEIFYRAGPVRNTFWLAKWMTESSYKKYQSLNPTPPLSINYVFILKINGIEFYRW